MRLTIDQIINAIYADQQDVEASLSVPCTEVEVAYLRGRLTGLSDAASRLSAYCAALTAQAEADYLVEVEAGLYATTDYQKRRSLPF